MARRHEELDARSLALHAAVARKIPEQPEILQAARERVAEWLAEGSVHRDYAAAWQQALEGPRQELLALLVDPGERARALRQTSPFAGALEPRERWEILRRAGMSC